MLTEPRTSLDGAGRRLLRARAHALKPVVRVADAGLSPGVISELDRAFHAHELIKIHVDLDTRADRHALLQSICERLQAQPVQIIGKILVAFRARTGGESSPAAPQRPRRRSQPRRTKRAFQGNR